MKNLSFLVLTVALAIGVVSCGGKDSGGSSNTGFSTDPYKVSTVKGYINVQQPIVKVENTTYQLSSQSQNIVLQAINLAHSQGIPTVMIDGVQMLKANITGSLGQQGEFQQGGYPQQGGNVLNVTQAVAYR
jgi:predicted methyltransferase